MMRRALVISGDRIAGIKQVLHAHGIDKIEHKTGRKPGDTQRDLPNHVAMIVLVTAWLNHAMMYRVKHLAQLRGLTLLYTKNSADGMQRVLKAA